MGNLESNASPDKREIITNSIHLELDNLKKEIMTTTPSEESAETPGTTAPGETDEGEVGTGGSPEQGREGQTGSENGDSTPSTGDEGSRAEGEGELER